MAILDRPTALNMTELYRHRYEHMRASPAREDRANAAAALIVGLAWEALTNDLGERSAWQQRLDRHAAGLAFGVSDGPEADPEEIAPESYPARAEASWQRYLDTFEIPGAVTPVEGTVFGGIGLVRADGSTAAAPVATAPAVEVLPEELRPYIDPNYITAYLYEMRKILRIRDEDHDPSATISERALLPAVPSGFHQVRSEMPAPPPDRRPNEPFALTGLVHADGSAAPPVSAPTAEAPDPGLTTIATAPAPNPFTYVPNPGPKASPYGPSGPPPGLVRALPAPEVAAVATDAEETGRPEGARRRKERSA